MTSSSLPYLGVRTIGQVVFAATVLIAPWCLGAIEAWAQVPLFWGIMTSLVLGAIAQLMKPTGKWCSGIMFVLLLFVIGFVLFQLAPMSMETLQKYSPRAAELREQLLPSKDSAEYQLFQTFLSDLPSGESDATISIYPSATRHLLALFTLVVGTFFAGALLFTHRKPIELLVGAIVLNGVALAFMGIVIRLVNPKEGFIYALPSGSFSSFLNKNNAAGYLCICLGAAVAALLWSIYQSKRFQTLLYLQERGYEGENYYQRLTDSLSSMMTGRTLSCFLFIGIIVAGILVSYSRGGCFAMMGSLLIGVVTIALTKRFKMPLIGFGVIAILGIGLVTWSGLNESVNKRLSTLFQEETFERETRPINWRNAMATIKDYQGRGTGFGTYQFAVLHRDEIAAENRIFVHAENQYIEILTELGYLGFAVFALMLILAGIAVWILLSKGDLWMIALGSGMLIVLTGQLFASLSDFGLYIPANAMLLAAMLGLLCANLTHQKEERKYCQNDKESYYLFNRGFTLGFAAILLFLLSRGGVEISSIDKIDRAQKKLESLGVLRDVDVEKLDHGIEELESAIKNRPESALSLIGLASYKINRYRRNVYQELVDAPVRISGNDNVLWSTTSLEHLHRQIYIWKKLNFKIPIQRIRNASHVQENLFPAFEILLKARANCPVVPQTHLLLAELVPVVDEKNELANFEETCIERATICTPFSSSMLYYCGVLENNIGNKSKAHAYWKQSLTLSNQFLFAVVANIKPTLKPEKMSLILEEVFPNDPKINYLLYISHFPAASAPEFSQMVKTRAEKLLVSHPDILPADEYHYYLGHLYFVNQDYLRATDELEEAIRYRSDDASWRYLRAQVLFLSERYKEANDEIQEAIYLKPGSKLYRDYQKKINLAIEETRRLPKVI